MTAIKRHKMLSELRQYLCMRVGVDSEQSHIFLYRHGRMRARETRHIFTFSLAARGSEERRTTARGLALVYHSRVTLMCNSCKVARIYFHSNVFFKQHCRPTSGGGGYSL